jgi:hypothetical protein
VNDDTSRGTAARRLNTDTLIVWLVTLGVIAEGALSYVTSYQHIYLLTLHLGWRGTDARTTPLAIDVAIVALALVRLYVGRKGGRSWWLPWALWGAVLGTVAANAEDGMIGGGMTGAILAGGTAVLLAITVEGAMVMLRVSAEARERADREAAEAAVKATAEAEAQRAADEAERAARLERNSARGKRAAATREARKASPGDTGEDVPLADWERELRDDRGLTDPNPTGAFPGLSGIGLRSPLPLPEPARPGVSTPAGAPAR